MDQLAFIILNGLAQVNVLFGQILNSQLCLSNLVLVEKEEVETRTHVYGKVIRRYQDEDERRDWVKELSLLPRTGVWDEWKVAIKNDPSVYPKKLYDSINKASARPTAPWLLLRKDNSSSHKMVY